MGDFAIDGCGLWKLMNVFNVGGAGAGVNRMVSNGRSAASGSGANTKSR